MLSMNTNSFLINHLRNQTIVKQRLLLKTNGNKFVSNQLLINNYSNNGKTNVNRIWGSIKDKFNEKLMIFSGLLGEQFNIYMALRIRRMAQILGLYNRIYSEKTVHKLMSQLIQRMRSRALTLIKKSNNKSKDSMKYILSAVCGVFCWDKQRITDLDLNHSIQEFECVERVFIGSKLGDNCSKSSSFSVSAESDSHRAEDSKKSQLIDEEWEEWEPIIMREDLRVWRKAVPNTSLYQYKVFGTFHDIPARTFFSVQMDTDFRKVWDKLVVKLDIIEKEPLVSDREPNNGEDSGNEVLHWVMRYPFPMNTRDYVYLRRSRIDVNKNVMVLVSKSIEHPRLPETKEHVRVVDYSSKMVIKPHNTFDECGFDYMLTYFDDPRAAFPSPAYNWMASCGVPDFVEKLHLAAVQLHYSNHFKYNNYSKQCYTNPQTKSSRHSAECVYA